MTRCANCGANLAGPYCHECGQEASGPPGSLLAFLEESVRDALSLRSRTVRSLIALVGRPGELTAAYFDGRRVRYANPLSLYLVAAAIFFLANSFHPFITVSRGGEVVSSLSAANAGVGLTEEVAAIDAAGGSVELFRERSPPGLRPPLAPSLRQRPRTLPAVQLHPVGMDDRRGRVRGTPGGVTGGRGVEQGRALHAPGHRAGEGHRATRCAPSLTRSRTAGGSTTRASGPYRST